MTREDTPMTADPLTAHAHRQPGVATYAEMLGREPIRRWQTTPQTATRPAEKPAGPLESPPPEGRTPDGAETISAGPPPIPERTCPAGWTGPLPEIPAECYPPDAAPLPAAEIHVPGRPGHHTRVWETVSGWVWSCPECDARGVRLPDQQTALTAAVRHAEGPLPWWVRLLDRITRTPKEH